VKGPGNAELGFLWGIDDTNPTANTAGRGLSTTAFTFVTGAYLTQTGEYGRGFGTVLLIDGNSVAVLDVNVFADFRSSTPICRIVGAAIPAT
jgi:hypothetical protein